MAYRGLHSTDCSVVVLHLQQKTTNWRVEGHTVRRIVRGCYLIEFITTLNTCSCFQCLQSNVIVIVLALDQSIQK